MTPERYFAQTYWTLVDGREKPCAFYDQTVALDQFDGLQSLRALDEISSYRSSLRDVECLDSEIRAQPICEHEGAIALGIEKSSA
jgi:hypothetical protein